jgi:O-antigen ligase
MIFDNLFQPWENKRFISSNLHFLFTCLVAITLPINVDSIQFCSIATALLLTNWLFEGDFKVKFQTLFAQKSSLLLFAFYGLHLLGMTYTSNTASGLFDLEKKISLLIIPLVLLSRPLSMRKTECVLALFVSTCVLLGIIGSIWGFGHMYQILQSKENAGPEHVVTYFIQFPRVYFSLYLMFCLGCVFYFYNKYKQNLTQSQKVGLLVMVLLMVAFLFQMASRMNLILLVVFSFALGFYELVVKRKKIQLAFTIGFIGFVFFLLAFTQIPHLKRFMSDFTKKTELEKGDAYNSVNLRVEKMKSAKEVIAQNWLWGVGIGDVQDALNEEYRKRGFELGYTVNLDTHNQYLQTWIGLGIFGLLLLVSFYAFTLWEAFQVRNFLLFFLILHFGIASLSEALLITQKGIVFFSLFYPLVYHGKSMKPLP